MLVVQFYIVGESIFENLSFKENVSYISKI